MIKCSGFGKLLKQLFIISLISCFGLLGNSFVNASFSLGIVGQDVTSVENQNYDISILSNYDLKTTFGGVNKRLFAPKETEVWRWGTTGNMHYSNVYFTTKYNGIVKYFYICDYIETLTNFSNCTKYLYSSNLEVVKNILNNVSAGDTFFYGQAGSYMEFNAVSVQSLDETIVFPVIAIQRSSAPNENTSISAIGISFNGNDCNNIQSGWWVCNLDNYDNSIGYDFSTLPDNLVGVSPGYPSLNDSGSGSISSYCTYQQIFDYAESNGYSEYLCYGGLDNFNLYNSSLTYDPIPGTGKTLGQILAYSNAWDTPQDRFIFWNGLYLDRYNNTYNAMWESYPAVYRSWFDLYYRFGGSSLIFDSVREYCAMKMLDIDFNTTFYKGQYFKNTCTYIKNGGQYPGSGTGESDNVVGVNWIGVGNIGSGDDVVVSSDPTKFIQDFFNKLKENLPTRYDLGGGFLPLYIITFMCAIILFRFLSH